MKETAVQHQNRRLSTKTTARLGVLLAGALLVAACSGSEDGTPADSAPAATDLADSVPPATSGVGHGDDGHDHDHDHGGAGAGLVPSLDGFTLVLEEASYPSAGVVDFAFTIAGETGVAVTDFDVHHEKELHLVLVSHDLSSYLHLHPEMDASGRWSISAPIEQEGFWHVVVDFVSDGKAAILGTDIKVGSAPMVMADFTEDQRVSVNGPYTATLVGDTAHEASRPLKVEFTRDGVPVTSVNPYLGANAHMVAFSQSDLGYTHMHPNDGFRDGVMTFTAPAMGHDFYKVFVEADFDGQLRLFEFVFYGE